MVVSKRVKRENLFFIVVWLVVSISSVLFAGESNEVTSQWFTPQIIESPVINKLDSEGEGSLYQVGELKLCVLKGDYYDMGFQHGRLLASHIRHVIKEGYLKKALWDRGYTSEYVYAQSARMVKHIPKKYLEEAKGIIDGLKRAGIGDITLDELLVGSTVAEILHFPPNTPPESGQVGFTPDSPSVHTHFENPQGNSTPQCTNIALWGKWTEDGRILHGRNLDWSIRRDAQDDAVVFVYIPKDVKPYLLLGWAGGIGSLTGMNMAGITVGQATLPTANSTFDGRPCFVTVRMVLEQDTIEKAVDVVINGPEGTGWNYMICDIKTNSARAIESDPVIKNVYVESDPKESEETKHYSLPNMIRRTNHPVSKEGLVSLAKRVGPLLKPPLKVENWEQFRLIIGIFTNHNTYQRYDWIGKQFQARDGKEPFMIQTILELLANGPVYNGDTLHSCVFDPKNFEVYISNAGNNPPLTATRRPYTKIKLTDWVN
ncbi:MAG: C45 family autoproteolytic acyltransferase/hydrolase [Candidatus Hydrogenedentes bacterium]|nr:C45 family autoproteolytic acyltransferase/hydrolase [Candidatus Hydrogenedentota bacterium]